MDIHKEFVRLGKVRRKITNELVALLPDIERGRIWAEHGYSNIYDYAAKIAGLSPGVVEKALRVAKLLEDKPILMEKIKTHGVHKVGLVAGIATQENQKELAEKVEHMSKLALQEFSKEKRCHHINTWQIELDEEMMFMFLKLKKKFGDRLSNKEALRKILQKMQEPQRKAKKQKEIPGKVSRYIPVDQRPSDHCSHPGCHRPADVIHHPTRFSQNPNHSNLKPLCRLHHEFAHNGITEKMQFADYQYRKCRQEALL
ncbi:hypothetical protein KJ632_05815 [Patescibacteria group bacterium]|nr:hypothetical protein [Patescibacteria group bacterium]